MSDSKISALPTKAVPISADILPIVDSTVTDNKKITIGSLPISTAAQTALNNKVDKIVGKGLSTEDYTTVEKSKLAGIATGATANQTDAYLLDRTNHTGTQAPSTIVQDTSNRFVTDAEKSTWNSKEPAITAGTTAQYWRGDKSWQTLDKAAVGLGNVNNTSDANKPVSTATQTALNLKVAKAGDTMTNTLTITGANGVEFAGLQVNNTNTAGYCAINARADDGEVIQIAALNSGGAGNAYGMWTVNQFGLYSKRTLNILTDTAGAEIKFATGTGAIEVAKIDSTGKFSSNGISLNSGTVENVPTPTVSTHAANKDYVDIQSIVKALIFG